MHDNTVILNRKLIVPFDWQAVLRKSAVLKQNPFNPQCFDYKNIATISAKGKYFCVHPSAKCMDVLLPILEDAASSFYGERVALSIDFSAYGSIERITVIFPTKLNHS